MFHHQFQETDFSKFRDTLYHTNFDECFLSGDPDQACSLWTDKFLNVAKTIIPNKIVTIRPNDSPWYTNDLRNLKKYMMRCFRKYKKSKLPTDWDRYCNSRNTYQHGLNTAENNYKKSLTDSLSTNKNSKKWWSTVKWLIGKGGDTSYPSLIIDGKQVNDNKDKAEAFNTFFLSHSIVDDSLIKLPDVNNFPQNLNKIIATEEEVHDLLKCIDTTKATGPDGISPKLLHEAGGSIVKSLTRLINLSLETGRVPKDWKLANVIPLFKKGVKHDTNNYRPVSLLSCVSKILERIVFKHVFNYLRDNQLISSDQSGFKPGDSTTNQLSFLYHTFCKALDEKKDVHIIFFDIRKAFDRVYHKGLIYKLRKIGIYGNLLVWFIDYLHERHQRVIIRGQESEKGLIKAGVPQGSVLGPLLFLIYINDLTLVTQTNMKLFADDTSLYIEFDNADTASAVLNQDLVDVQAWANQWLVEFSPPKTKLMTCTYKKKVYPPISFDGNVLQSVINHKHLGLTFANNLHWSTHIESILDNVGSMADILKKLKYDLDRQDIEKTYFAFIRPKLEYASHIWDNCSQQDSDKLENFQLDIARIVTGARRGTSHNLLYKETCWMPLKERRSLHKLKSFSKIVNKECPLYLQDLLPDQIKVIRPNSRNAENFVVPKCRTECYRKSFIPSAISRWNEMPLDQRCKEYFNKELKIKSNPLYYEGRRTTNVKHSQLRMKCSKLNSHLFLLHVTDSSQCLCGYYSEDSEHYLLQCNLYNISRYKMLKSMQDLGVEKSDVTVDTLLFGTEKYDFVTNKNLFNIVHIYIEETARL